MNQLLSLIYPYFESRQLQLQTFYDSAVQCEGWFKGELLTLLSNAPAKKGIKYNREVPHNKRRIDFIIKIREETHYVELKHWCIGRQKQNTWKAKDYFGDKSNGIYNDVEKLSKIKNGNCWILVFATKNPGFDNWKNGIERFNQKFRRFKVSSTSNPSKFPDYYFCGLLKIE